MLRLLVLTILLTILCVSSINALPQQLANRRTFPERRNISTSSTTRLNSATTNTNKNAGNREIVTITTNTAMGQKKTIKFGVGAMNEPFLSEELRAN